MKPGTSSCYHCGRVHPADAGFCGTCGSHLKVPECQTCHQLVSPESLFCGRCGAPFAGGNPVQIPALLEDQLRQVTVLFALLSGLQSMVEQLDPEILKEIVDECFRLLTAELVARGGTIDKYMADSLLALFGVPRAHEDDPVRAVSAARGMLEALEPFNRRLFAEHGFQLELKVGINSGKVLVGHVGGGPEAITVMGDVVNTASRVEQAAPVGTILICDSTRRGLGGRFKLREQPPLRVKGKSQPLKVFRVLPAGGDEGRAGLDLSHIPLIGRAEAFDQLALCWRQIVRPGLRGESWDGMPGAWATVLAEVGMGKGRLLREFERYVARDPCEPAVLSTWGISFATASGAALLRRLVESLAGVAPDAPADALEHGLAGLAQNLAGIDRETGEQVRPEVVVHRLRQLMGADSTPERQDAVSLDTRQRLRQEGFHFLRELCAHAARERPLLLIADDLQWGEEAALDFLELLGNDPPPRLMLLCAARPTLLERRPQWAHSNPSHRLIELRALRLRDAYTLAAAILGPDQPPPSRLVERLHAFTGGNPFYLTELLRDYLETQETRPDRGDEPELQVPVTIEGVLQSRLDRLPFEAGLTLRVAALVGATFWRGAVAAALGSDRAEALELLCERGFIRRRPHSALPGEEELVFDHPMTARVASGNLLERTRRRYHRAIADWLVSRHEGQQNIPLLVAHHYEAAGEAGEAVRWLARAGEMALEQYDCVSAVQICDRALEHLDDQPSDRPLRSHLLSQRGEARRMQAEFRPALEDFLTAAELAQDVGDPVGAASCWFRAGLVQISLGDYPSALQSASAGDRCLSRQDAPLVVATGLHLRSELLMTRGQLAEARVTLDQALALWRRADDRWHLAQGLNTLGKLLIYGEDPQAGVRVLREVAELRERLGDTHGLGITLHNLGAASDHLARHADALAFYHRSLRLHRRVNNRTGMASTLVNQGQVYARCGYFGRARVALEEALELNRSLCRDYELHACLGNLGSLWLQLGRPADARPFLRDAVTAFERLGDDLARAEFLTELGVAALLESRLQDARELGSEAFRAGRLRAGSEAEARALLFLGHLAVRSGDRQAARDRLEELEWCEAVLRSPRLQLHSSQLAGRLLVLEARLEAACERFREAERIAREHDMMPDTWRSRRLLLEALRAAGRPCEAADAAMREAQRELMARLEDRELVEQLETDLHRMAEL